MAVAVAVVVVVWVAVLIRNVTKRDQTQESEPTACALANALKTHVPQRLGTPPCCPWRPWSARTPRTARLDTTTITATLMLLSLTAVTDSSRRSP